MLNFMKCLKLQTKSYKKSATSDVPVPDVVLWLVPVVQRPVVAGVAHGVSDTNTSLVFVKYVCLMFVLLVVCICEGICLHLSFKGH